MNAAEGGISRVSATLIEEVHLLLYDTILYLFIVYLYVYFIIYNYWPLYILFIILFVVGVMMFFLLCCVVVVVFVYCWFESLPA